MASRSLPAIAVATLLVAVGCAHAPVWARFRLPGEPDLPTDAFG